MVKNKNIKDMSINEASDFWDEHDFGEFDDAQEVSEVQFSLKKKKYVGIDGDLYAVIKNKAKTLNKSEDVLINEWLSEKAGT
ncbi:MAG: CopG family antitoxin [Pseudomonadota bacterium]